MAMDFVDPLNINSNVTRDFKVILGMGFSRVVTLTNAK